MIRSEVAENWKEVAEFCADLEKNVAVVMDVVDEGVVTFGVGTQGQIGARYLKKHGIKILCSGA
jgi:hypothetical protein